MIQVRMATQADLQPMLDIYNDIIVHTAAVWHDEPHTLEMRAEWFATKQQQGFPVFVATEEERVVGFSTIGPFRPWPGYRYTVENSVYVASDCRAKGIGRLLLEPLITASIELKLHVIVAGIDSENVASIRLHERFGFREAGHFHQVGYKFGRWLDLTFLELVLPEETPA